jgi:hypothetical protein
VLSDRAEPGYLQLRRRSVAHHSSSDTEYPQTVLDRSALCNHHKLLEMIKSSTEQSVPVLGEAGAREIAWQ